MARERKRDDSYDRDDSTALVLSDLVNRVLDKGVVIRGNVLISVADIDLIALDLRLLLTSIQAAIELRAPVHADPSVLPGGERGP